MAERLTPTGVAYLDDEAFLAAFWDQLKRLPAVDRPGFERFRILKGREIRRRLTWLERRKLRVLNERFDVTMYLLLLARPAARMWPSFSWNAYRAIQRDLTGRLFGIDLVYPA